MSKKNILFITCDELCREALSLYGNRAIETANIDSLAREGTRFDNAFTVSPWCLPARCAMLTGLYPHHSGAYSNFRKCPLDTGVTNMFRELKKGGYHVSMFGKCHFAPVPYGRTRPDITHPYDEFKDYYMSLGLDHLDLEDDKQVSVWFMDDWAKEASRDNTLEAYRSAVWNRSYQKVFPFPARTEMHPDVWVANKAIDHITSRSDDSPLFAWVSFSGPHYPMDSPREYIDRVDPEKLTPTVIKEGELLPEDRIHHKSYYGGGNIDGASQAPESACRNFTDEYWVRMRQNYNANVLLIDDMVGRIVKAAKEKYGNDLVILFSADHGDMLGNHGMWGKHNCAYNEVWRIPMILSAPDAVEAGAVRDELVNTCDIMPTFLELAGLEGAKCDGVSLLSDIQREYTFAEGEGYIAVTDGRFKYVHVQKRGEQYRELLDNLADPCEFDNLIGRPEYQSDLARLREKVIEHFIPAVLP